VDLCPRPERRRPQGASHKPRSGTIHQTLPYACRAFSPATGAKQAARNQERYRTAGCVLPRSPRGEWTCVLDPNGDDRKARAISREAALSIKHYLTPAGLNSPATGAKQAARNQERYRTAGCVLPRSPRGEWTCVLDPSGDDRKARPGKARSLRVTIRDSASIRWSLCANP